MMRTSIALILCLIGLSVSAQSKPAQCLLYGYVEAISTESATLEKDNHQLPNRLSNVTIYLHDEDSLLLSRKGRETGFYALILPGGKKYRVTFEKEGYFCKTFEFDLHQLDATSDGDALKCVADVELFPLVDNKELRDLSTETFARGTFNPSNKQLVWDRDYIMQKRQRFYELAQPYYLAEKK
jgi:hypothetical protein